MPRNRRALGWVLGGVAVAAIAALLFFRERPVPPPVAGKPDATVAGCDTPGPRARGSHRPATAPEDVTLFAPRFGAPSPAAVPPPAPSPSLRGL